MRRLVDADLMNVSISIIQLGPSITWRDNPPTLEDRRARQPHSRPKGGEWVYYENGKDIYGKPGIKGKEGDWFGGYEYYGASGYVDLEDSTS